MEVRKDALKNTGKTVSHTPVTPPLWRETSNLWEKEVKEGPDVTVDSTISPPQHQASSHDPRLLVGLHKARLQPTQQFWWTQALVGSWRALAPGWLHGPRFPTFQLQDGFYRPILQMSFHGTRLLACPNARLVPLAPGSRQAPVEPGSWPMAAPGSPMASDFRLASLAWTLGKLLWIQTPSPVQPSPAFGCSHGPSFQIDSHGPNLQTCPLDSTSRLAPWALEL